MANIAQELFWVALLVNQLLVDPQRQKPKVMLTLSPETFKGLEDAARRKGISIQELLRAIIIPQWLRQNSE
jgi:hypothetical protein